MITIENSALIKCEEDIIIWRYVDLEKFELLLNEKALFLCRSDKFSDPFEGSIPKREALHRDKSQAIIASEFGHQMTEEDAKSKSTEIGDYHKKLKKAFVVNCWNISTHESDAMWRLYLKTNEGVAIQSSFKRLYTSLQKNSEELYISKVRYIDYENGIWYDPKEYPYKGYNVITPIVHKRIEFKHENELRVFREIKEVPTNPEYWESQSNQIGKNISCEIDVLIDKIILPPTSEEDVLQKVSVLLSKHGLKKDIVKSKLDSNPIY